MLLPCQSRSHLPPCWMRDQSVPVRLLLLRRSPLHPVPVPVPVPVPEPVGNDLLAMTLALSQARAQLEQERVISRRLLRAALERVVEHCERSGEDPDVAFVEAATGCTVAELQRVPTEKANRLGNLGFLIAPRSRHFVGNPGMLGLHAAYEDASMQPRHSM